MSLSTLKCDIISCQHKAASEQEYIEHMHIHYKADQP